MVKQGMGSYAETGDYYKQRTNHRTARSSEVLGVRSGDKLLLESDGKGMWISAGEKQERVLEVSRNRKPRNSVRKKWHQKMVARNEGRMTTAGDTNVA